MIILRNETNDDVTLKYNDAEITIDPDKFIQVNDLDEVMLDSAVVKIRRGVIKIKSVL